MRTSWILAVVWVPLAAGVSAAQTSYPMITHCTPQAAQRGQTSAITVEGRMNFAGAYKVLIEGAGVSAEVVPPPAPKTPPATPPTVTSVQLKVTVAPDAALGVREFRIATKFGLSSLGQLLIVDDPVVQEQGNNNTLAQTNAIPVPCVVCGRIEAVEDVDNFKFRAEAGQTLSFEVFGARIEDKIHDLQKHLDPFIALFDTEGRELAANDDFYFADPFFSYTIPRTGEYVIQIRDSKYDGDPRWTYAMIVTQRPYVSHVYPMAGNPGQVVQVEPVGSAKSAMDRVPLTAPDTPGIHQVPLTVGKDQTYPIAFIVSELPQVLEQEPNDTPAQAQRVTIPCGINGRIGVNRDLDHFVFAAKKGAAIRFEVKARRFGTSLQSSLDSVLDVMNAKGTVVATNDDLVGKDAGLVFTPPADGDYILRIRDLNSKGGDTAVYYIEAEPTRPDFAVKCDPDKAMIGPGSSMAWFAQVTRVGGFTGPVTIEVHGLPQGVTASPLTISPTMTQGVIVVTAAADAPLDATNVRIVARGTVQHADGRAEVLERPVTSMQEIYFPGGGRGQFDVNMQSVAVTEPSDILHVEVSPKIISMKPGEEVKIDVTVQRRPDYDKSISLDIPLKHLNRVYADPLPPGVTIVPGKSKTLLGAASQGHIVLKAAPNAAPIENVPISVMCHVSINFVVKVSYASAPILVSVRK